jgi:hypothetical protein
MLLSGRVRSGAPKGTWLVGPATARRKKPIKDGTVIRELITLRAALRWALAQRWISKVPS